MTYFPRRILMYDNLCNQTLAQGHGDTRLLLAVIALKLSRAHDEKLRVESLSGDKPFLKDLRFSTSKKNPDRLDEAWKQLH